MTVWALFHKCRESSLFPDMPLKIGQVQDKWFVNSVVNKSMRPVLDKDDKDVLPELQGVWHRLCETQLLERGWDTDPAKRLSSADMLHGALGLLPSKLTAAAVGAAAVPAAMRLGPLKRKMASGSADAVEPGSSAFTSTLPQVWGSFLQKFSSSGSGSAGGL